MFDIQVSLSMIENVLLGFGCLPTDWTLPMVTNVAHYLLELIIKILKTKEFHKYFCIFKAQNIFFQKRWINFIIYVSLTSYLW